MASMIRTQSVGSTQKGSFLAATTACSRVLQRKCACGQHEGGGECESCRKKTTESSGGVQRKARPGVTASEIPASVHEVLASPGRALDAESLSFFGSRLTGNFRSVPIGSMAKLSVGPSNDEFEREADGAAQRAISDQGHSPSRFRNFSHVRVHTDARAGESAKAVGALAYTAGANIVFAPGQFAPHSRAGQELLAHELTHVAQQLHGTSGASAAAHRVQRQEDPSGGSDDDKTKSDRPKDPIQLDDPNMTGITFKFEDGKPNYCISVMGHEVCKDSLDKIRAYMKTLGQKKPAGSNPGCPGRETPWGSCCKVQEHWDYGEQKCVPFKLPQSMKCLPGETPNILTGGCCKPGEFKLGCMTPAPTNPVQPAGPDKPKDTTKTSGAAPPAKTTLHFQLDLPQGDAAQDEGALLKSLVPADQSVWRDLLSGLRTNPDWKFQLVGRASPEGTGDYNFDLARRRAELVRAALLANGITADRIVDVAPECDAIRPGVFDCGKKGSTGPQDRQVKVVFLPQAAAVP
jgi:hypothetical protein